MGKKYTKDYEINYYNVDAKLNCSITSIVNLLADIGTVQSEKLGVGMDYCKEHDKTWVFYQYDIKINKYPKCYDKLTVETDPSGFKKFYASREYKVYNKETTELMVSGEAIFFYIDLSKRRAVRIPEEQYAIYGIDESNNKDFEVERLEKLKEAKYSKDFSVRYSDIDSNRHVNNTKYIEWAMEVMPIDIVIKYNLNRIRVTFEKECTYGEDIVTSVEIREAENGEMISLHNISTKEGKNLSTLICYWNI